MLKPCTVVKKQGFGGSRKVWFFDPEIDRPKASKFIQNGFLRRPWIDLSEFFEVLERVVFSMVSGIEKSGSKISKI